MQSVTISSDDIEVGLRPLELSIIAGGTARLTMEELAESRRELLKCLPKPLSPQLLRHSDEQTLTSLMAISEAIRNANMTDNDFHDWAVASSSRNLGRSAFAAVIDKYRDQGPWGVSVQVIPHCTAHAVAGTISLALDCHGPCIGAGGGVDGEFESLYSAACILRRPGWFGAWIVFSGWSPELAIDAAGRPTSDSQCLAAAIAVTREWSACSLGRICFRASRNTPAAASTQADHKSPSAGFLEFLLSADGIHRMWSSPPTSEIRIHAELSDGWCESIQRSADSGSELLRQTGQSMADPAFSLG
jgi:hypothetical protein